VTELPGLRAMLSETAERRYPRRRARRLIPATLAVAAIAAAVAFLLFVASPEPEIEAVATPVATASPTPTVATGSSPTPAPAVSNTRVRPRDVAKLRDTRPVLDDLASGGELVRAWAVPALRGNVHLIRKPDAWCISVPDPLADQPDLERGKTCTDPATFQRGGIQIGIGATSISLGAAADAPLVVTMAPTEKQRTSPRPATTPTATP
jgi:hypothetical protein